MRLKAFFFLFFFLFSFFALFLSFFLIKKMADIEIPPTEKVVESPVAPITSTSTSAARKYMQYS